MERVLSLDLSSKCIGVLFSTIDDYGDICLMQTSPLVPVPFSADALGYGKSKKKVPCGKETAMAWMKPGETTISQKEKKARDVEVRAAKDKHLIGDISTRLGDLVDAVHPTQILVEKNAIFNGVLTTVLLAKIMGSLQAICALKGIPFEEIKVASIRKHYDMKVLLSEYVQYLEENQIKTFQDMTKESIGHHLQKKYSRFGLSFLTNDESDAVAVFDYWYERRRHGL